MQHRSQQTSPSQRTATTDVCAKASSTDLPDTRLLRSPLTLNSFEHFSRFGSLTAATWIGLSRSFGPVATNFPPFREPPLGPAEFGHRPVTLGQGRCGPQMPED